MCCNVPKIQVNMMTKLHCEPTYYRTSSLFFIGKCSDRSMVMHLPCLFRNFDEQTDRSTNQHSSLGSQTPQIMSRCWIS